MLSFDQERYYKTVVISYENIKKRYNLSSFLNNLKIYFDLSKTEYNKDKISVEVVETLGFYVRDSHKGNKIQEIKSEITSLRSDLKIFCKDCINNAAEIAVRVLPSEESGVCDSNQTADFLKEILD